MAADAAMPEQDLALSLQHDEEEVAMILVLNILRTHNHLSPFIGAGLREQKLTVAQFNTLLVLRTAGDTGLLMGEIGERLVVTKSNVTGLIDRLESQGLVERRSAPDRRAISVCITDAGLVLVEQALPEHRKLLAGLTDELEPEEKRQLVGLLTKLRRGLRRRT